MRSKPARKTFGRSFLTGAGWTFGVLAALAVVFGGVLVLPFQPDGQGSRFGNIAFGLQFGSGGSSAGLVVQVNPMHWRIELATGAELIDGGADAAVPVSGFRLVFGPLRVWLIVPQAAGAIKALLSV